MVKTQSLVAGEWLTSDTVFSNEPASGTADQFAQGTPEMINRACEAAEEAFWSYGSLPRTERAAFLRNVATQIDALGGAITAMGTKETGLPEARLEGERGRTVAQIRLFADHIEAGDYLDERHEAALPDRSPLPRPDLRLIQRPVGPVGIFGASNFPLAFSVAGGDTASALAAGCPVVVKGHPAHPGLSSLIAQAFDVAIRTSGVHPGVFSMVHDGGRIVGETLVKHPLISAIGFTGSLRGGRALFDLCAQRPIPIPFFGELGSTNPMFILPEALANRADAIARNWAGSLTQGCGQFCTNPGIVVLTAGERAEAFTEAATEALGAVDAQTMLTSGIASVFAEGRKQFCSHTATAVLISAEDRAREASPCLLSTSAETWLESEDLGEEVFGPLGLLVVARDMDEMLAVAKKLQGQLTATLHMDAGDTSSALKLLPILERKAGRVLANGFPTGVEVCDAMVHGGPYPASTNFGATSVGTLAIRRFLRPVCYQNIPADILPLDLQN